MPLYDRRCTKCEHVMLDLLEPIGLDNVTCPECGSITHRLISAPGLCAVIGDPESALNFANVMDARREKSRRGHGNTRIRATANERGELTIDGIDKDK